MEELPGGSDRRAAGAFFAPFWAGLTAALSTVVPVCFFAPLLLPMAAGRLSRSAFGARSVFQGFLRPVLAIPAAFLLGVFLTPQGAWVAAALATALLALPAAALFAGARDGRRRDHLTLLVTAVVGIGGLAGLLGILLATGKDPGAWLAARWAAFVPELIATCRKSGWSDSYLTLAGRAFELVRVLLAEQLPGLVLGASVLYAAFVVYPIGNATGLLTRELTEPSFARFSTPIAAAVLFVPVGLLATLGPPEWSRIAVDLLLPLAVLFFLRGLAIIRALLDRGRAGLFGRALVYTLVFHMPFPVILALGGLFDEFLNIRGRLDRAGGAHNSSDSGEF